MVVRVGAAIVVAALLWGGGAVARAQTSCPGGCPSPPSHARFEATTTALAAFPTTLLTATLKRGSPKRVVTVDATMSSVVAGPAAVPITLLIVPQVNGLVMDSALSASADCGGSGTTPTASFCSVSGNWWIDLDQHPALIGVPLTVTLLGGAPEGPVGSPVTATMSVRLEKK